MKKYQEAKGYFSKQKVIKISKRRSKVLIRKKLDFGVVASLALIIPIIGDLLFSIYLLGLARTIKDKKLVERAKYGVGSSIATVAFLVLAIITFFSYKFVAITSAVFFMITWISFRIITATILIYIGGMFKEKLLTISGYLFPFLIILGPLYFVGVFLIILGFYNASKSKILIKSKKF